MGESDTGGGVGQPFWNQGAACDFEGSIDRSNIAIRPSCSRDMRTFVFPRSELDTGRHRGCHFGEPKCAGSQIAPQ
ncbi:hypothetical protein Poly24_36920 [Rosistilla carotiformis]|uniref:Uncharacterized protein n=1 Tax=Rosistilla carotiformis TaxID=2528017 RepID=A0A518JWQ0_9BACT|nr:hypothetical protein Poly24_36920 [Rosistilla carotiformis]